MNQLKPRNEKKNPAGVMTLTVIFMYAVSVILLFILAFLLYQMELTKEVVKIGIIVIYIISGFAGGFFAGRQIKDKKYLWGLLAGGVYYVILVLFSLLAKQGMEEAAAAEPIQMVTTLILCAVSGMAGGMLS